MVIHQVMDAAPAAAWELVQEPGRLRLLVARARPSFDPEAVTTGLRQALESQKAAPPRSWWSMSRPPPEDAAERRC
jgi:hypothetical protein